MITTRYNSDAIKVYQVGSGGAGVNNYVAPDLTPPGAPVAYAVSELIVNKREASTELIRLQVLGSDYTISPLTGNVVFTTDNQTGDIVVISRATDADAALVVLVSPFEVDTKKLNKASTQWFLLIQEIFTLLSYCLRLTLSAARGLIFDFNNYKAINLSDPVEAQDAVNLRTLQTMVTNALTTAGLGATVEGTLAVGATTIVFTGNISGVILTIAGTTFLLKQGESANGGTLVYSSGTGNTTVTLDEPIMGTSRQYIAILFQS